MNLWGFAPVSLPLTCHFTWLQLKLGLSLLLVFTDITSSEPKTEFSLGCTLILKPPQQSPLSTLHLGELVKEAGIPPGVINIVPGFQDAGEALTSHPNVIFTLFFFSISEELLMCVTEGG